MPPEERLKISVLKFLRERGGFFEKTHGNDMTRNGMPDIVGCYRGQYVAIELKAKGKKPTDIQLRVLKEIRRAGGIGAWADDLETVERAFDNWPMICRVCLLPLVIHDRGPLLPTVWRCRDHGEYMSGYWRDYDGR